MKTKKVRAVDENQFPEIRKLRYKEVEYQLSYQIGVGAFSRVYLAADEWGNKLIVKVINKDCKEIIWRNEVNQLIRFQSAQVPNFFGTFSFKNSQFLIMENAGWPLGSWKSSTNENLEQNIYFVAKNLLEIVHRVHAAGFIHGDINPQNILIRLDKTEKKIISLRLVDFSFCRHEKETNKALLGTALWNPAPEYFKLGIMKYSSRYIDIWHVGIILLNMVSGVKTEYTFEEILEGKPHNDAKFLNSPLADVIAEALSSNPHDRPPAVVMWRKIKIALGHGK